jgi:hypothetical protein
VITRFAEESGAAIWSAKTGDLETLIPSYGSPIESMEMSADEKWILTLSQDGTGRIWPVDVAGYARQFAPRELLPVERELFQIGEKQEREKQSGLWTLNWELKSLQLLERVLDGTVATAERVRPSYHHLMDRLCAVIPIVDLVDGEKAETRLLASLKSMGRNDGEAHLKVARMQVKLARQGAASTIEQGLAIKNLDPEIRQELENLVK